MYNRFVSILNGMSHVSLVSFSTPRISSRMGADTDCLVEVAKCDIALSKSSNTNVSAIDVRPATERDVKPTLVSATPRDCHWSSPMGTVAAETASLVPNVASV